MPATWLNKYGYGSEQSTASAQPVASSQPTWINKYGNAASPSATPMSPAFQNALQNRAILNQPPQTSTQFPQESIVQPQQPQQNFFQKAVSTASEIGKAAKQAIKQTIDFLPQVPSFTKSALKEPKTAIASAGEASLTTFASLAGLVQNGIATAVNVKVPERWDVSKQAQTLPKLSQSLLKSTDEKKAYAVGNFLGQILPYALSSEVVGASVGAKLLVPTASKYLPGAVKFIPTVNNAIGFLGIGQVTHDPENGSRVDQFKNDLIMLGMFETGGLVAKGLSKGTRTMLSSTIKGVKGKPKIDFETTQPKVQEVKDAFKVDTGKPPEVIAVEQMATGHAPKLPETIQPYGTKKTTQVSQTQIPQETQTGFGKIPQIQAREGTQGKNVQVPQTPIGEGQVKPSKLGLRVEQTAIEKKLTTELKDLPTYQTMNMKEQAQKAADLLKSDPEKALRIALQQEAPPSGLQAESVFKAMEGSITTSEMARQLAKSPLVSEATAIGQRIKALDVRTSESSVEAIKQVIDARAKTIESRLGKTPEKAIEAIVKNIQKNIKAPNKYDWNAFIEGIKC